MIGKFDSICHNHSHYLYDSVLFFSKLNEDEEGKKDKEYRLLITRYDNNDLRRDINKYLEENIQMDI